MIYLDVSFYYSFIYLFILCIIVIRIGFLNDNFLDFKHLENDALRITEWFPNNFMKLNEDKCHLMSFGAKGNNEISIRIGEACVKESTEENLLGITFDQSISFKQHVKALCKKAGQKLHALARISRYMDTEKQQQLMRASSYHNSVTVHLFGCFMIELWIIK